MIKKFFVISALSALAICATWLMSAPAVVAEPAHVTGSAVPQDHAFLGARDGCRKCHLKQYRSWEATPHAAALESLEGSDAENPECVRCHVTGYGEETGFKSVDQTPQLAGVTCEACHGAGSGYVERETMKDRDASVAGGLKIPNEQTCLGCHNSESPQFPGSFDYEAMKAAGLHEMSS